MKTTRLAGVLGPIALAVASLGATCGAQKNIGMAPEPRLDMDPEVLRKFANEIQEYVDLRRRISGMLPPVAPGSSPEQISAHQQAMKRAIQQARRGAKRGDMFKKSVEAAFRRIIQKERRSPEWPAELQEIKQGNPKVEGVPMQSNPTREVKKNVPLVVNGDYPEDAPFSSVPSSLLLKLPQLPNDVRYRFVGRALILRDTEANVILDYLLDAIPDPSIPR